MQRTIYQKVSDVLFGRCALGSLCEFLRLDMNL